MIYLEEFYLHLIYNWGTGLKRSIKMCNDLEIIVEVINDGIGIRVNIYRNRRAYH
ncbi:MAG: hypothetical protein IKP12_00315 [Acholeplasmatales bacterium]|nr:hypothetical protein [Acholeplasmatales bacterium]